jgi:hypothetical protein
MNLIEIIARHALCSDYRGFLKSNCDRRARDGDFDSEVMTEKTNFLSLY